jgi:hypothetical protein
VNPWLNLDAMHVNQIFVVNQKYLHPVEVTDIFQMLATFGGMT